MAKDRPLYQKIMFPKAIKSITKVGRYIVYSFLILSIGYLNNNLSAETTVSSSSSSYSSSPIINPASSPSSILLAPLITEGVAKYVDKKGRNPTLTVQQSHRTGVVTLLAHAVAPSKEFEQFPIQIDFFVNGAHFASQISSPSLPRPLGIDVPSDRARLPFNYTVIARIIHPNSVYTSMLEGAAFEQITISDKPLNCSISYGELLFESTQVIPERISEDSYLFSIPETSSNSKATLKFSIPSVSGSANSETSLTTTGTVTLPNDTEKIITGSITLSILPVSDSSSKQTSASSTKPLITEILLRDSSNEVEVTCNIVTTPEIVPPTVSVPAPPDEDEDEDEDEEQEEQEQSQDEQDKDLIIENVLF